MHGKQIVSSVDENSSQWGFTDFSHIGTVVLLSC